MQEHNRLAGAHCDVDAGSIVSLYEAHGPELTAYVLRTFRGCVSPDDVVQDAFARLIRTTLNGQGPRLARPWLFRVAHNIGIDELRRRAHTEPESEDHSPAAAMRSAEADFETVSIDPDVRRALASLPVAGRTAILMTAEGYSSREIAVAIGRSDLATRALLCRTRKLLRCALDPSPLATERAQAAQAAA